MIVFHLLMTGVLSLKESFIAAGFMLPLPVITILFFLFIQQHCLKPSMYLSINMASGLAEASPRFLQVSVVCCVLREVWCEVYVVWYTWCGMCDVSGVICDFWCVVPGTWWVMCDVLSNDVWRLVLDACCVIAVVPFSWSDLCSWKCEQWELNYCLVCSTAFVR